MSMERRALIAFAASMALFVLYDSLYLGPKMKHERARREAIEALKPHTDSTGAAGRTPAPPTLTSPAPSDTVGQAAAARFASADTTRAPEFVVASPLYEITLSARGAEVVSARLLHFTTHQRPVELIPPGASWSGDRVLAETIRSERNALALSRVLFEASAGSGPLADGARLEVPADRPLDLTFRTSGPTGSIERTYRFYVDRYDFETGLRASQGVLPGATGVSVSLGPGIASTERNPADDNTAFKASLLLGEELHRKHPRDFGRDHIEKFSGTLNWASVQSKYFLLAVFPDSPTRADVEVSGVKQEHHVTQRVTLPATTAGDAIVQKLRVYFGPLDYKQLERFGNGLQKSVDFGWQWIRPVSTAVLWSMTVLYKLIPNYGWVIIVISVLAKVLFYRLTHKSFKSMKEMQDLQPRLQALKEKFGDDKRRLSEETMKLYKEAGVNPLGGCLPMLLQMPVFIALYGVLRYNIALRGAPFVGWINDLSQQDVLFKLPIRLPFIGNDFSLLPLLMGLSMWGQSKLGGSPTGQASPMPPGYNTMLPIVFTVLFYRMPSGLVIYWIINTTLSVVQQYYIVRDSRHAKVAAVETVPARKRGRARKG